MLFLRSVSLLVLFCAVCLTATEVLVADFKPAFPANQYTEQECIVKFNRSIERSDLEKIKKRYNFQVLSYYRLGDFYRVRIPQSSKIEMFLDNLKKDDCIQFAHPDYFLIAQSNPNDPLLRYQWNLGGVKNGGIQLLSTQNRVTPYLSDVVVALIDGGVAYENNGPFKNASELSNTLFLGGFDFVDYDRRPNDDIGHGTHIATLIASNTNNNFGAAGIAQGVMLLAVKVINRDGIARTSDVAEGILYAVAQGASILNISLGGPDSPILREALQVASDRGVLCICAAGNNYPGVSDSVFYPAAYDECCMAVGAHGINGIVAPYSIESDYIDCSAPGGINRLDYNDDGVSDGIIQQTFFYDPSAFGFYSGEGTSYAAAHVSGVAALLKGAGINGPEKIRQAIEQSCVDRKPAGWDRQTGWGYLNASGALSFFPPLKHDIIVSSVKSAPWCIQGEQIQISVIVKNQGMYEENTILSIYDSLTSRLIASANCTLKPAEAKRNIFVWDTESEIPGVHSLMVTALLSDDEDPEDNISYKEITVVKEHRDVAITGTEFKKDDLSETIVVVQICNNGTYSESIHVELKDPEGVVLGGANATIDAQTDIKLSLSCDFNSQTFKGDSVLVTVVTSDRQETDLENNRSTIPLRF